MFDNISFQIDNYTKDDFYTFVESLNLPLPRISQGKAQTDWHNLRINYFYNENRIKVSNSIHKFYSAEIAKIGTVNHNQFTFTQVDCIISVLEHALCRKATDMKLIGRFEYGVNIFTGGYKPFKDIIDRYQSIVTTATNSFYASYNPYGKPYGKFCPFTHYTVKCYDKAKQMNLFGKNILRYEIVHNSSIKTREIFCKEAVYLSDLRDRHIWDKCFSFLIKTYDKIRVLAFPTESELYAKTLCYSDGIVLKDYRKKLAPIIKVLKSAHDDYKSSGNNPHAMVRLSILENYEGLRE